MESEIQEELQRRVPYDSVNRGSRFAVDDGPAVVIVRPMSPFIILTFQEERLLPDIFQVPAPPRGVNFAWVVPVGGGGACASSAMSWAMLRLMDW